MTKHTSQDFPSTPNTTGGNPGVKKFRYTQPKKKTFFDDDDDDTTSPVQWNFTNAPSDIPSPRVGSNAFRPAIQSDEFDLDDVWSIKRNINVPGRPQPIPSNMDGWSKNVGKNYYSRHGGLAGNKIPENKINSAGSQDDSSPKLLELGDRNSPHKTFSYSYSMPAHTGPVNMSPAGSSLSPITNRFESQGMSGLKGRSTMGRYGVHPNKPF